MPLQIRRGTTAERTSIRPVIGELIYDSTLKQVFVGDSTDGGITGTLGGNTVSSFGIEDAQDAIRDLFNAGTHTGISFSYDDASNRISATVGGGVVVLDIKGSVFTDDTSTVLVDAVLGAINLDNTIRSNVIPYVDSTYDLGSASKRFKDLYLSGSSLYVGNAVITATGSAINLPAGSTVGGVAIGSGGTGDGVVAGMNYNINIVGDDSTLIVNATNRSVTAAGGFTGNLTGNVTGNISGVITGTAGSNITGSVFATDASLMLNGSAKQVTAAGGFFGDVTGDLVGNVQGNTVGYHTGDVRGSVVADDSTMLVDGVSGRIVGPVTGNSITSSGATVLNTTSKTATLAQINLEGTGLLFGTTMTVLTSLNNFITESYSAGGDPFVNIYSGHGSAAGTGEVSLTRSRGTLISPSAVQNNDELGHFVFTGHDGSNFQTSSRIISYVDGAVSAATIPSRIAFSVTNSTGTQATKLTIKSSAVEFAVPPKLPVVADDTARTALVASPSAGMLIFMQSGTTPAATNVVQVYDGSNWVNLH
jgi:hypothetical protein